MSNKMNSAFLNAYIELDKICCAKFGTVTGGVTEYINRLISSRFAPERDDVLPRLVKYRNIRNRIAHEEGALKNIDEVTKTDIKWIDSFRSDIAKKKDPLSVYLRKARKYARRRRALKRFAVVLSILAVLAVAAGVLVYFLYLK